MNFNTFFLDKLSSGGQSINTSQGKNTLSSYLFSDIMKVYEREGRTTQKSKSGFDDSIAETKEKLPAPVNVIKCNERRIKKLSRFIDSFTANSREPINTSESKQDLKPVVIKKKQFLLSSSGIEEFLKGVVESTDLNYAVDIKKTTSVKEDNSKEVISIDAAHDSNSELEPALKLDSSETDATGNAAENIEEILQSILNFIANNKSMSLSFKSDFEKVNINIYALPEDNFETKINLEKLASDFLSTGTKVGETSIDSSNDLMSTEQASQLFANISEDKPAEFLPSPSEGAEQLTVGVQPELLNQGMSLKAAGFDAAGYDNIYKTEITEIAYKPSLVPFSGSEDVQQEKGKIALDPNLVPFSGSEDVQQEKGKIALDPNLVSKVNNEKSAIPDAKFRLTNNLSAQLSVDVNADKAILKNPVENPKEGLSTKILLNQLNGKLVNVEFKKSADDTNSALQEPNAKPIKGQNTEKTIIGSNLDDSKNQFTEVSGKPVDPEFRKFSGSAAQTNSELRTKTVTAQSINQSVVEGEAEDNKNQPAMFNNKPSDSGLERSNTSNAPQNHEVTTKSAATQNSVQSSAVGGNEDSNNQFVELNGKLLGLDLKKTTGKNESNQNTTDIEGVKSASGEHTKMNELSGFKADGKTTDGKDSEKHGSGEGFKNILQGTEQVKSSNPEVFKITPELKSSPEVQKTIKTHEIIPEFAKIIQGGEKQSMTFQLTPENLGKVKLIVELVDSKIVSRIEVENEQVKQFIQSNVEQLKQNLQNSGIQLSSVNISLTESEQKYSKAASPRKKMGEKASKVKDVEEHTRPAQKSLGYNTYEFLA